MSFLFAGIIAAAIAVFAELFVSSSSDIVFTTRQTIVDNVSITPIGLLLFAAIEELLKLGLLMRITMAAREHLSFPVRTGLFALGFGTTELFLAKSMFTEVGTVALAGIFAVHFVTIFLYGFALSRRFSKWLLVGVLITGIVLHFSYNFFLI